MAAGRVRGASSEVAALPRWGKRCRKLHHLEKLAFDEVYDKVRDEVSGKDVPGLLVAIHAMTGAWQAQAGRSAAENDPLPDCRTRFHSRCRFRYSA